MPRSQDEIVIPFRLDTGEADRVLERTRARVASSALDMSRSADRAQAGFTGMEASLRGFARAEAQEDRTIRRLSMELTQLGLVGGRTAQAFSTIAFSLAGGFGLGAALNLVQLAVGTFTERQKRAAEEAEKLRQAQQKLREEWEAATKPLDDLISRLERKGRTEAEIARQEALIPLLKREAEAKTALEIANEKAIVQGNKLRVMNEAQAASGLKVTEWGEAWRKGVDDAAEALRQVQLQIEAVEIAFGRARGAESFARDAEAAKKAATTRSEAERAAIEAELQADAEFASARGARSLKAEEDERQHLDRMATMRSQAERAELEETLQAEAEFVSAREGARLQREQSLRMELRTEQVIRAQASTAWRGFAQNVAGSLGQTLRASAAYTRAMKAQGQAVQESSILSGAAIAAFVQDALASVAQEAVVEALWNLGRGFAALGLAAIGHPGAGAAAAAHFKAAALYGLIAAVAGAGAAGIGSARGMTASERASVASAGGGAGGGGTVGATSGGGPSNQSIQEAGEFRGSPVVVRDGQLGVEFGSGISGITGFLPIGAATAGAPSLFESEGRIVIRETVVVIGDPFETPAETARRAARRLELARDLDMTQREG